MSSTPSDAARRKQSSLLHLARRALPTVVLLWVLAGAYFYWRYWDAPPAHVPSSTSAQAVPVDVVTVQPENVPVQVRFLGQTEAALLVEIRARVAGYLDERTFTEGELVQKGQKLFQIDPRPFEVQVSQAKAGLASAEAQLERATQQLRRYEQLTVAGAVSEQEIDDWRTQQRVAMAAVQEQKAQIAAAQLQLDYATISSPITGMIGQALKDIGSYVDAGQNGLLATVQQVDPIYVRYAVTEQDMLRFQRQQAEQQITVPEIDRVELEITLSDGSIYGHRGRINFVDVQIDATTGTSAIRGEVPNPDGFLKPGQFIYTSVLGIERINVIRVPQIAVLQSPSGASVLVVADDGKAESRPVTLGEWSSNDSWIIESGLNPGDRVITSRLMMVRPGMPVTIAGATPAEGPAAPPAEASAANSAGDQP